MSTPVPIRFDDLTLVFRDGEDGFQLLILDLHSELPDEFIENVRQQWPNVTDPVEIVNMGPPNPHADRRLASHPSFGNLVRFMLGERELPVLFALRWGAVFRCAGSGTSHIVPDSPLTVPVDLNAIEMPEFFRTLGEPIALIPFDDFHRLRPQLEALRDGAVITTSEGVGRVINP